MAEKETTYRFENATVVVTGSTRGIGAEISKRFAQEGANVVVSGRSVGDGEDIVENIRNEGGEASFVRSDLRNPNDVSSLIAASKEKYGQIDTLVNNAAIQTETSADEVTIAEWDRVLETNFRSYWLCAKHAYEHMDRGSIVNISSNHAALTMPSHFPYNAVKAGIDGMTRAMALDFGPEVRVNTVNPGWVAVERTTQEMTESDRRELESIHPVGRIGESEDVAGAVAFLASEDAAFITGASLLVDGGRSTVMQDDTLPDYRSIKSN